MYYENAIISYQRNSFWWNLTLATKNDTRSVGSIKVTRVT